MPSVSLSNLIKTAKIFEELGYYLKVFITGDAEKLKEMVLSIPHHVTDTHLFPENKYFQVNLVSFDYDL